MQLGQEEENSAAEGADILVNIDRMRNKGQKGGVTTSYSPVQIKLSTTALKYNYK